MGESVFVERSVIGKNRLKGNKPEFVEFVPYQNRPDVFLVRADEYNEILRTKQGYYSEAFHVEIESDKNYDVTRSSEQTRRELSNLTLLEL